MARQRRRERGERGRGWQGRWLLLFTCSKQPPTNRESKATIAGKARTGSMAQLRLQLPLHLLLPLLFPSQLQCETNRRATYIIFTPKRQLMRQQGGAAGATGGGTTCGKPQGENYERQQQQQRQCGAANDFELRICS